MNLTVVSLKQLTSAFGVPKSRLIMRCEASAPVISAAREPPSRTEPLVTNSFYNTLSWNVLNQRLGQLDASQKAGIVRIVERTAHWPITWRAYALATAWHETATTMRPIEEYGGNQYFFSMYDIEGQRPHKAREIGNLEPGDGIRYRGRGYVQLTGRDLYRRHGLEHTPERALDDDIAVEILVNGMENGTFTGVKLSQFSNYVDMRKVINGRDRAEEIAVIAEIFEESLRNLQSI